MVERQSNMGESLEGPGQESEEEDEEEKEEGRRGRG